MKNRKIISLICAIAMIMSLFTGITVNATGSKGIELEATLNDDATELTVVAKAVGMTDGITAAEIDFTVPETAVFADSSYTSFVGGAAKTWNNFAIADNQVKMNFFENSAINFDDNILATVTVKLSKALDTDYAVSLVDTSSIKDTTEYFVGDGADDMPVSTSTASNPLAKTEKPEGGKPTAAPEDGSESGPTEVPADTQKKGIKLEASLDDTNTELTVIATALNMTDGITAAEIDFTVPETAVFADSSYTSFVGGAAKTWNNFAIADNQVKMNFFENSAINFDDNVLATVKVKLSAPATEKFAVTLVDTSSIKDTTEYFVGDGADDMVATSVVVTPNEAPDTREATTVDLEDYMGVDKADDNKSAEDVAKAAEADPDTYGDLWIDVKITKENDEGERVDAAYGTDYVAIYDGKELSASEYQNLISGNTDTPISEVISGLQFKVFNTAKNVKIDTNLFAEKKDTSLVNKNETTDVTPDDNNGDDTNSYKLATLSASPTSKTYTVGDDVTIKFTYDTKDYAKNGKFTFAIAEDLADYITNSGIKAAYKDADGKDVSKVVITDGKEIDIADIAAKGTITLTFKAALKTSKAQDITLTYEGENEEGTTVKAANKDKDLTATSKVSIKNETTTTTSSGGSGSTSSGGGAIANGLVNTTTGALPGIGFSDLSDAEWARDAINALSLRNIVSGYPDGTFNPNGNITRAEYAQILINAIGHQGDSADTYFDDVPTDAWFYHNVAVASQLGIISGYGDGNFGPYDLITREQMALMTDKAAKVMSVSLAGASVGTFSDDADIADWSRDAVYELANAGIINGMGDGTFAPKANATRAQAATIIYNTFIK